MKWDHKKGCPILGTYKPLDLPGSIVLQEKKVCEETGTGLCIPDKIASLFEGGLATVDEFFKEHLYKDMEDMLDIECLLALSCRYRSYETKLHIWAVLGGSLDFDCLLDCLHDKNSDIPSRFYFCETEEDIWDILLDGCGKPREFVYAYSGISRGWPCPYGTLLPKEYRGCVYSEERLRRFMKYMISNDCNINNILFDTK